MEVIFYYLLSSYCFCIFEECWCCVFWLEGIVKNFFKRFMLEDVWVKGGRFWVCVCGWLGNGWGYVFCIGWKVDFV